MITYVIGDATRPPISDGIRVIAHVCNDAGSWGAGFVLALSARDTDPEISYETWSERSDFGLGEVQVVEYAEPGLYVANMVAQHRFGTMVGREFMPPIRYTALACCLNRLHKWLSDLNPSTQGFQDRPVSVHMPRIGCGLGGGTWENVELLIEQFLCKRGVPVTVYDLPVPVEESLQDTSAQDVIDRAADQAAELVGTPAPCCGPEGCTL